MADVIVKGDTSGAVTLSAPAVAGTVTVTLPSTTGTMLTTASTTGISGSAISSGTVPEAYGGTGTSTGYYGFKNRIINGAMVIDQRNAGASYTQVNSAYNLDRWAGISYNGGAATDKFSVQRSTTAPTGFSNSMLVTSLSASATTTSDIYNIEQKIEGFNFADFMYGTANAQTFTLSFWVRSSLTGTFGGAIKNQARNRAYPFTYTISAANTFEYKTITIAGDTTGTWVGATNGTGLYISFGLGVGSGFSGTAGAWAAGDLFSATGASYVVSTNGATFYITGVQLEKGSTATSFDYRPFGTELALCQRYFAKLQNDAVGADAALAMGMQQSTTTAFFCVKYPVTMRGEPTATISGLAVGDQISFTNAATLTNIFPTFDTATITTSFTADGAATRPCCLLILNNTAGSISFSAEL